MPSTEATSHVDFQYKNCRAIHIHPEHLQVSLVSPYLASRLVCVPQIAWLDGEAVSHKEKVHALNVHGQDVDNRMANFAKHFPGAPFINHLPPLAAPPGMSEGVSESVGEEEERQQQEGLVEGRDEEGPEV